MGALLVMLLLRKSDVRQIAMWLGINIVITFTAANISWQGHLGGLVGGALLGLIWSRSTSSPRKESMPVIAVGLIFITVVAGIVLRGWMLSPI
jgi:membrane associated rhomboid family serine protease